MCSLLARVPGEVKIFKEYEIMLILLRGRWHMKDVDLISFMCYNTLLEIEKHW